MLATPDQALAPGFTDAVREAQTVFRALMNALARPTSVQPLAVGLKAPPPLTPELAAIALALGDADAPLWLDGTLAANPAVASYLRFHTGAPIVADPFEAAFALVASPRALPSLEAFAWGTEDFPDRSATVVLAVESLEGGVELRVNGPGLAQTGRIAPVPLPPRFTETLSANHQRFPRGVDWVFAAPGALAALPRSARLVGE